MHPAPVPIGTVGSLVPTLVSAILGLVLTSLGAVFTILGALSESDEGFGTLGPILLVAGLACAAYALTARSRRRRAEAARTAARTDFATATVVSSSLNGGVRVNGRHPLTLTVELPGHPQPVTAQALVFPNQTPVPGTDIEVAFAPGDPANFLPV